MSVVLVGSHTSKSICTEQIVLHKGVGERGGWIWAELGERVNMIKIALYQMLNEPIKLRKFKRFCHIT